MQFRLIYIAIINLIRFTIAFNDIHPSYVNHDDAYYVSEVKTMPSQYKAHLKQIALQIYSNATSISNTTLTHSSTITTPAVSLSSSTLSSIQTETMTAGMTYLYSDNNDEAFFVNVTIDCTNYPVLIDTGSPYLWLYSSSCDDPACKEKKLFQTKDATKINGTFALSYDSGVASGSIYEDKIIIAGYESNDFEFGVADNVPGLFESYDFSGVLGLPADNTSTTGLVNAVSFLYETGEIDASKFTICIGEYESDSTNSGLLFLGSTKDSLHVGDIYTSSIIENSNHWEFKIDTIFVDQYQISFDSILINNVSTSFSRIGLLDSGTTSLVLPPSDANIIHSFFTNAITDGENYAILCNSTLTLEFEISGKNWSLTPEMYIGNAYSSSSELAGYCVSNIQGLNSTSDGTWILGILFMQNKYVEFDYENQWIGLAERNQNIKFVNPPDQSTTSSVATISIASDIDTTMTTSTIKSTTESSISSTTLTKHSNNAIQNIPISNSYWSMPLILFMCIMNLY